jgi:hypothetical protein
MAETGATTLPIMTLGLTAFSKTTLVSMEQYALQNVNNCLNTSIYSYLETSGGQSSDPYLNVFHFFNTRVDKKSVAA